MNLTDDLALAYLQARTKIAMARVMLDIDQFRSAESADEAVRCVLEISRDRDSDAQLAFAPWPIRDEPVLAYVFERAEAFTVRARQHYGERDAALEALREQELERGEAANARERRLEKESPDPATMLAMLKAGERLVVNGHDLEGDGEFETLMGTNAYGLEYYLGGISLRNVTAWRTHLLAGKNLGECPRGCDDDDGDSADDEEYEVWQGYEATYCERLLPELLALESAAHWCTNPRLKAVEQRTCVGRGHTAASRTCDRCKHPPSSPTEARALLASAVYPHRRCCQEMAPTYAREFGQTSAIVPFDQLTRPAPAIAPHDALLCQWMDGVACIWTALLSLEGAGRPCECDGDRACSRHVPYTAHGQFADDALREMLVVWDLEQPRFTGYPEKDAA